ncbi:MAG: hypothetical protein JSS47_05825 [Proteobacteria bacterium]|nr:hypothetical protein [Pseudomonadota bacterium]
MIARGLGGFVGVGRGCGSSGADAGVRDGQAKKKGKEKSGLHGGGKAKVRAERQTHGAAGYVLILNQNKQIASSFQGVSKILVAILP